MNGTNNNENGYTPNGYNTPDDYTPNGYNNHNRLRYERVRKMIEHYDFDGAEAELNAVQQNDRDAEWNYLMGTVMQGRGWLEDANRYFGAAYGMDPNNPEYRDTYNNAQQQRSGTQGGNNTSGRSKWCNGEDICACLMCSDCMCDICDICGN